MLFKKKKGKVLLTKAPDFTLLDQDNAPVKLSRVSSISPVMLVFYPMDFSPVCSAQLCDYRDHIEEFSDYGVQIFGISAQDVDSHKKFATENNFPFLLLSDPGNIVAKDYGCTSLLMLGNVSLAIFIIKKDIILYRYVEKTGFTRRQSHELIQVLKDLSQNSVI